MDAAYEPHYYKDPTFPVLFHYNVLPDGYPFLPHWHENWEILYFIRGSGKVLLDAKLEIPVQAGEVVIVPSNSLHQIFSAAGELGYYCLIIDRAFCAKSGFDPAEIAFQPKVRDTALNEKLDYIVREFRRHSRFHRPAILACIVSVLVYLARNYPVSSQSLGKAPSVKSEIVKSAFRYAQQHYAESITIEELAQATGFSKYYFCHVFKEMTGMTPSTYINFVKCRHARELLFSGTCSVNEAASNCGFENLSYFSKVYKKYIGELPSRTAKHTTK